MSEAPKDPLVGLLRGALKFFEDVNTRVEEKRAAQTSWSTSTDSPGAAPAGPAEPGPGRKNPAPVAGLRVVWVNGEPFVHSQDVAQLLERRAILPRTVEALRALVLTGR